MAAMWNSTEFTLSAKSCLRFSRYKADVVLVASGAGSASLWDEMVVDDNALPLPVRTWRGDMLWKLSSGDEADPGRQRDF